MPSLQNPRAKCKSNPLTGGMWIGIFVIIAIGVNMRTVQMTLDEKLVEEVDKLVGELKTTRSAFTRDALRQALLTARTVA